MQNFLRLLASLAVVIGGTLIVFARPLGAWYEGMPAPTMSDLGFIAGGMLLAGLGLTLFIVSLLVQFWSRHKA